MPVMSQERLAGSGVRKDHALWLAGATACVHEIGCVLGVDGRRQFDGLIDGIAIVHCQYLHTVQCGQLGSQTGGRE